MPRIIGMGAFTAIVLGVFDFTGGKLTGWTRETDEDRFERKEYLRKNRRRSGEETIAQLGDGRAGSKFSWQCRKEANGQWMSHGMLTRSTVIHSPNYDDLRAERLKEKYGYEIKTVSADPNAA